jgi:hypothetical protein
MLKGILVTTIFFFTIVPVVESQEIQTLETKEEVASAMGLRPGLSMTKAIIGEVVMPGLGFAYAGGLQELKSPQFIFTSLASVVAGVAFITAPTHKRVECIDRIASGTVISSGCTKTGYTITGKLLGAGFYLATRALAASAVGRIMGENNKILKELDVHPYYNGKGLGAKITLP